MKRTLSKIASIFITLGTLWFTYVFVKAIPFYYSDIILKQGGGYFLVPTYHIEKFYKIIPVAILLLIFIVITVFLMLSIIKKSNKLLITSIILIFISTVIYIVFLIIEKKYFIDFKQAEYMIIRFSFLKPMFLKVYLSGWGYYIKYSMLLIGFILSVIDLFKIRNITKKKQQEAIPLAAEI